MRRHRIVTSAVLGACTALSGSLLAAAPATAAQATEGVQDLRLDQWGLEAIGASDAWETTRGAGVTVAVLDTGVDDTHPDLSGSVAFGPDLTGQGREPGNGYAGEHGTMMAGIIAASGHGREHTGGVMGVAPEAGILSIRVASDEGVPSATPGSMAKGLRHAVSQGVQVIVVPIGDGADEPGEAERQAIEFAQDHGVLVVAAGGVGGVADFTSSPESYEGVLTVAPVGQDQAPASPAPEGVALTAPGAQITTTGLDGGYADASGGGAAAAFTAGVAALVRAEHPQLRPEQVAEALVTGADTAQGAGAPLLNAPGALEAAGRIAQDVPPFDPELAQEADEGLPVPAWTLWAGGALVVVVLAVVGVLTLRRRLANPYDLPEREPAQEAQEEREERPRRGRRRKTRGRGRETS
ncbi:S8 family serine peptidase [Marinactinospora thermotolerans]|uniref:Subtilisin-like serine proteases n=1 Tax=Marinactinospora thermotolerans DSM 45154 TaxID=1122192 RepID=A0A1T4MY79_9ACTN|nr:S8 family serine peptidase [Marinactinospora thermotolerans]SJZ72019.1 Subtilisin-like serine proteases [Marinactinospora thermotolerans DSM 45154]